MTYTLLWKYWRIHRQLGIVRALEPQYEKQLLTGQTKKTTVFLKNIQFFSTSTAQQECHFRAAMVAFSNSEKLSSFSAFLGKLTHFSGKIRKYSMAPKMFISKNQRNFLCNLHNTFWNGDHQFGFFRWAPLSSSRVENFKRHSFLIGSRNFQLFIWGENSLDFAYNHFDWIIVTNLRNKFWVDCGSR